MAYNFLVLYISINTFQVYLNLKYSVEIQTKNKMNKIAEAGESYIGLANKWWNSKLNYQNTISS